ncbi:MAG TPA: allantoinase AllB [Patescibacteria group bacterium]|nr:allantoinase AllB [Patescibacteria group bacterium]
MTIDLAINDARIVLPGGVVGGSIGIADGRIAAIATEPFGDVAAIDGRGRILLPGLIETHGHFWDPGPIEREDWRHGTAAAAAGGITTVIEMPLSIPPTVDADAFRLKLERARAAAHVDYLLWGGIIPAEASEITRRMEDLQGLGAVSYKVFMCRAAAEFPACDDGDLFHALHEGARLGQVMGIHAENDDLIHGLEAQLRAAGRNDPMAYAESRPPYAEAEAIARVISMARETGAAIYIVHMSLAEGAALIKAAKQAGQTVFVETCPQYLALDDKALREQGPWAKCAPPLRPAANTDRLWEYVLDGTIDTIGSDHAPFTAAEKEAGSSVIWDAPNGLTGIQTMLPLLIDEGIGRRGLSWPRLAEITAGNAARIFRLAPRKGSIAIGADADLVLVDPDADWTIRGADLLHKNKWTPYEGRRVRGRVDLTMVRGTVVYDDGTLIGEPGFGQFVGTPTAS